MAKEIAIKGYECEKCGKAYVTEYEADICCKEYFCEDCGTKLDNHMSLCSSCSEKRAFNKAKKMTYEEYLKEYSGNMLVFGDDFFSEMEDVIDHCECFGIEIPKYVWGTYKRRAEIDVELVEEFTLDDTFEDAEFDKDGINELAEFIEKWNKKYGLDYYEESNIVVFVPEDMTK
ncbi:MAG: hypothetical protein ACI3T9_02160 [Romboutsia timonensis]